MPHLTQQKYRLVTNAQSGGNTGPSLKLLPNRAAHSADFRAISKTAPQT